MVKSAQRGNSSIVLIILVLLLLLLGFLYFTGNLASLFDKSSSESMVVDDTSTVVNVMDEKSLYDFCVKEIKTLPEPNFTYIDVDDPAHSSADSYIVKYIPEDKQDSAVTCRIAYNFDSETAYQSVGLSYVADIRVANAFADSIAKWYGVKLTQIDQEKSVDEYPNFKQLLTTTDAEAGRPGYSSDSLPAVFTRTNLKNNVVEYVDISLGIPLYVKMTVHTK